MEANKLFGRVPRFSNDGEAYGGRIHASHYFRDGTGYSIKLWGDSVHRNGIVASIDEYISGIHPDWERKENTL